MEIKLCDLLQCIGGNTKIIIVDYFSEENKVSEIWRGKVDELDFDDLPAKDKTVYHVTIVAEEDWLQICV